VAASIALLRVIGPATTSDETAVHLGDTAEHAVYMLWDAGGNAVYVDGSSLSIAGTTFPAAVPNYGATTWNYGVAQSGAESINSDCGVWMTGKTALTGTEITNLTNFYMNL